MFAGILVAGGTINSGPTFNGVAMTSIGTALAVNGTTFTNGYFYYLTAPATGSNTFAVGQTTSNYIYCELSSYAGVAQSSPIDTSNSATGSGTSISISTTVNVQNDWLAAFFMDGNGGSTWTAGASTTMRNGPASGWTGIGDSNADQSTGSQSLAGNNSVSSLKTGVWIAAFKPFVAASAAYGYSMLMRGV